MHNSCMTYIFLMFTFSEMKNVRAPFYTKIPSRCWCGCVTFTFSPLADVNIQGIYISSVCVCQTHDLCAPKAMLFWETHLSSTTHMISASFMAAAQNVQKELEVKLKLEGLYISGCPIQTFYSSWNVQFHHPSTAHLCPICHQFSSSSRQSAARIPNFYISLGFLLYLNYNSMYNLYMFKYAAAGGGHLHKLSFFTVCGLVL